MFMSSWLQRWWNQFLQWYRWMFTCKQEMVAQSFHQLPKDCSNQIACVAAIRLIVLKQSDWLCWSNTIACVEAIQLLVLIISRPKYCASEFATCKNGPGWYECNCINPYVGNGNYCEYFNHCNNEWSQPCHDTAWCEYGPVFPQGTVIKPQWYMSHNP